MEILKHPLCTGSIGAPSDMPEPVCSALPVAYREDEHGKWTVSFWQPSADELAQLVAGGAVALHVRASGRQHPVVAMDVQPLEVNAPVADVAKSECTCPSGDGSLRWPCKVHPPVPGEWVEAERISNLSAVYEAIRGFADDPTSDAGIMIVREVMAHIDGKNAATAEALQQATQRADRLAADLVVLTERLQAAQADAARFSWALPLIVGTRDPVADDRAIVLALVLAGGIEGVYAVDAAMKIAASRAMQARFHAAAYARDTPSSQVKNIINSQEIHG